MMIIKMMIIKMMITKKLLKLSKEDADLKKK